MKKKPSESEEKKKKQNTSNRSESVSDVRREMKSERADAGGFEECPVCGQKDIRSLRHHVNYRAAAGDEAHIQLKEQRKRLLSPAPPAGPYFADGSGAALVGIILSFILQKRPALVIPEGWVESAGEAHQTVLEKHIGPLLKEKSDLAYLGMVWAQLLTVNMAASAVLEVEAERKSAPLPVDIPLESSPLGAPGPAAPSPPAPA